MNKKDKISKILNRIGGLKDKIPTTKDGNIDMNKFPNVPEVKQLLEELREEGVNGKWLFNNGFIPAGLLLGKYL